MTMLTEDATSSAALERAEARLASVFEKYLGCVERTAATIVDSVETIMGAQHREIRSGSFWREALGEIAGLVESEALEAVALNAPAGYEPVVPFYQKYAAACGELAGRIRCFLREVTAARTRAAAECEAAVEIALRVLEAHNAARGIYLSSFGLEV